MGAMPGASVKRAAPAGARQAEALRDGRLCDKIKPDRSTISRDMLFAPRLDLGAKALRQNGSI